MKGNRTRARLATSGRALFAGTMACLLAPLGAAAGEMDHHHAAHSGDGMVDHGAHVAQAQRQAVTRTTARYTVPDVTLTGMDGAEVSLREALGEGPVMVNFIYTTCTTVCPAMSATFAAVQRDLAGHPGNVRMVSISIDPEHDTPARLAAYARDQRAGPHWTFLTGRLADSILVQRSFGVWRGTKMSHAPVTLLRASADGEWISIEGFASAAQLVAEIERLTTHPMVSQR